jgi:hypothetical protein
MIKNVPVDSNRIELLFSGHIVPVQAWVPDPADPTRNKQALDPAGNPLQAADDETGELLWNVDVFGESVAYGGDTRAEVVSVQVRAPHQPVLQRFAVVRFRDLEMQFSKNFKTGDLRYYWKASGIANDGAVSKPAPANGKPEPAKV